MAGALLPLIVMAASLICAAPLLLLGWTLFPAFGWGAWETWYDRSLVLGGLAAATILGVQVLRRWPRRAQLRWFVAGGLVLPSVTLAAAALEPGGSLYAALPAAAWTITPLIATIALGRLALWWRSSRREPVPGDESGRFPECGPHRVKQRMQWRWWAKWVFTLGLAWAGWLWVVSGTWASELLLGHQGVHMGAGTLTIEFHREPFEVDWQWLEVVPRGTFHWLVAGYKSTPSYVCLDLPGWVPIVGLAACAATLWRADHRPAEGSCRTCGYNLTGNTTGVCPECGKPIEPAVS